MGQGAAHFFHLCRICGAGEILTAVSGLHPLYLPALKELLLHRRNQQAQHTYAAHLLWLLGAQLFTLGGGRDYPVPDVFTLFPDEAQLRDHRTADDVRRSILARLNQSS